MRDKNSRNKSNKFTQRDVLKQSFIQWLKYIIVVAACVCALHSLSMSFRAVVILIREMTNAFKVSSSDLFIYLYTTERMRKEKNRPQLIKPPNISSKSHQS